MTTNPENNPPPNKKTLPPLQIDPDLDPIYANLVRLTHSPTEIVLDFARMLPGGSPPRVHSRILMTPLSAKLFYKALGEHLTKYESSYGQITIPGGSASLADHLFRAPNPPQDPDEE